jgi:hypothetical protein
MYVCMYFLLPSMAMVCSSRLVVSLCCCIGFHTFCVSMYICIYVYIYLFSQKLLCISNIHTYMFETQHMHVHTYLSYQHTHTHSNTQVTGSEELLAPLIEDDTASIASSSYIPTTASIPYSFKGPKKKEFTAADHVLAYKFLVGHDQQLTKLEVEHAVELRYAERALKAKV